MVRCADERAADVKTLHPLRAAADALATMERWAGIQPGDGCADVDCDTALHRLEAARDALLLAVGPNTSRGDRRVCAEVEDALRQRIDELEAAT